MDISNWSKSHFCAYILLYVAHADDRAEEEEMIYIENFLTKLGIEESNPKDVHAIMLEVMPVFLRHSQSLRTNFVKTKWKLFYSEEEDMSSLLDEIEEMIIVDFNIHKSEIKAYGEIRKALGILH